MGQADWPAAILALAAELKLNGPRGERRIGAEDFFLGPLTTAIESTEILTEIRVPVISVPKTMDNDVYGTDYCIGFSTAVSRSVESQRPSGEKPVGTVIPPGAKIVRSSPVDRSRTKTSKSSPFRRLQA